MNVKQWTALCAAGVLTPISAFADDFTFEVGASYDRISFEGSQTIFASGGTIFDAVDRDTDDISIYSNWYFAGLSDAEGPRSRAAFVNRASSLSFSYERSDTSSFAFRNSQLPTVPSFEGGFDSNDDTFALSGRLVSRKSGWFGNLSMLWRDSTDDPVWSAGFGKYLWKNTTLGLDVIEDEGFDETTIALSFAHLGQLGGEWSYGVDLALAETDRSFTDSDSWLVGLALYPTRDLEFGVRYSEEQFSRANFADQSSIEGFASWFVTPRLELGARYGVDDVPFLGSVQLGGATREYDVDQTSYGLRFNYRF